jgi:hypothetical protein
MRVATLLYGSGSGWASDGPELLPDAQAVLWFAAPDMAADPQVYLDLRERYPDAAIIGCSTGGEIRGEEVMDASGVAAAVRFDATPMRAVERRAADFAGPRECGLSLAQELATDDLRSIFVLSDGLGVNGTQLIEGLTEAISDRVVVTGGLAGDGAAFGVTRVGLNAAPQPGVVAALGLYGEALQIGWGSAGGWRPFGPERRVTRSRDNVLYALDDKPALDLYKAYLGEASAQLPGSALLFPLVIRPTLGDRYDVVRTVVGVNEDDKSLIFAGDVPEGWSAQLMRGAVHQLVDGAVAAARQAGSPGGGNDSLAVLVSCIGRKLMMGQDVADEVEAISNVWGAVPTVGFYSYGEICPHERSGQCTLHNQTMTITLFSEAA